jgi:queuine/archaeosine tRNA-ribosyltransferase
MEGGTVVFMDSGGYEAKWFRDSKWSLDEYHSVIREAPHSVAFTYDLDDRPPVAVLESTGGLLGSVSGLIPIVHGFGASEIAQLADLSALPVAAVAVTERDLGDGLDEVAAAVRQVSRAVEDRAPIHVLGAGNPLSILAYAAAGASSFDGLDWCQTVADPTTGTMHHSKHLPLFAADHASGEGDYSLRLLGHNLIFFDHWMGQIRGAWSKGQLGALVSTYLPRLRPE